jgi:type I restriction enzyme S subunit
MNMGQSPESSTYNQNGDGLPFFQGNADFGEQHPKVRYWCNSPTKIAHDGDILISVRAPIGALNVATEDCCIGRGLAALTAIDGVCDHQYLLYALCSRVNELIANGTGSTFKAVSKTILGDTLIPIAELCEQRKIAARLDKTIELIALRRRQLESLDLMVKSRFVEMFGDPVTNEMGWGVSPLGELGELNRGISKHRPRNAPELLGGDYPLVQTGEVSNADLYINSYSATYSELGLKQSKMWPKGTLCITIAANIAKTAILGIDACFPDSVVGFLANERTNVFYMHYWFSFFQQMLEEQAPESAQKNINLRILNSLEVTTPPIAIQNRFADFVRQADKSKFEIQQGLKQLELQYNALMQKYFA